MAAQTTDIHPQFASAIITEARRKLSGVAITEDYTGLGIEMDLMHQHDGSMMQIAWNNVQAAVNENKYIRWTEGPLLPVEEEAMEAYNQHHHTSQYDGGILPGIKGIHNHSSNTESGFAFAVFYPSTTAPMVSWE